MGKSTPSLGDCNQAGWKPLLTLAWSFFETNIKIHRPVFGHVETGKAIQALAGNMEGTLQEIRNIYPVKPEKHFLRFSLLVFILMENPQINTSQTSLTSTCH